MQAARGEPMGRPFDTFNQSPPRVVHDQAASQSGARPAAGSSRAEQASVGALLLRINELETENRLLADTKVSRRPKSRTGNKENDSSRGGSNGGSSSDRLKPQQRPFQFHDPKDDKLLKPALRKGPSQFTAAADLGFVGGGGRRTRGST